MTTLAQKLKQEALLTRAGEIADAREAHRKGQKELQAELLALIRKGQKMGVPVSTICKRARINRARAYQLLDGEGKR